MKAKTDIDRAITALRAGAQGFALDILLPLARNGDPLAMRQTGLAYIDDQAGHRSVTEAAFWLGEAAARDDAPAAYELGRLFKYGDDGLRPDRARAAELFSTALELAQAPADSGSAEHQWLLGSAHWHGHGVRRNRKRGLHWMRLAAEQGDVDYQAMLGSALWFAPELTGDMDEAIHWTSQAAEQGHGGAQYHLAAHYAQGEEVPQDFRKAAKWYRRAARQGDAEATYNLACMYLDGEGMPPDVPKGMDLLHRAAGLGFTDAMLLLGMVRSRGLRGEVADPEKAALHFLQAIQAGCVRAHHELANEIGEGRISLGQLETALPHLTGPEN